MGSASAMGPAPADAALAHQRWKCRPAPRHQDDQDGGIDDGHAIFADIRAADDVDRREVVFAGYQEDHRAHRGDGAHEA